MKKVIFDTNFLIDVIRFKIDLDEIERFVIKPYKFFTIDKVVKELKSINNKNAKAALKLIELKKIRIIKTREKDADKALVNLANKDSIIATNDIELRKKLKSLRVKTIYLRKRKYLAIS